MIVLHASNLSNVIDDEANKKGLLNPECLDWIFLFSTEKLIKTNQTKTNLEASYTSPVYRFWNDSWQSNFLNIWSSRLLDPIRKRNIMVNTATKVDTKGFSTYITFNT